MDDGELPLLDDRDRDDDDDDDDKSTGFVNQFTPLGKFPDDDGDMMEMTTTSESRGATGGKKKQPEYSFISNSKLTEQNIMRTREDEAWAEMINKYPNADRSKFTATLDSHGNILVTLANRRNAKPNPLSKGDEFYGGLPDTIVKALGVSTEELKRQEEIKKQLAEAQENRKKFVRERVK